MALTLLIILLLWVLYIQGKISVLEKNYKKLESYLASARKDNGEIVNSPTVSDYTSVQKIEVLKQEPDSNNYDNKPESELKVNTTIIQKKSGFEDIILGNVFNLIGAIALIIGCAIFINLISPYLIFTPLMKTIIGLFFGTLMVFGGIFMKDEKLKRYSEILTGTGFAVLFITIFCTTILFNTFSTQNSAILGALVLIAAYYAADKQKTVSMILIALFGGYLNIFIAALDVNVEFIFGYLLFLNLLSVLYVYRNPDKSGVNFWNLIITLIYLWVFQKVSGISIVYPVILWGIYVVYDLIRKDKNKYIYNNINLLNWANIIVLTIFSVLIFNEARMNIGILLCFISLIYFAVIYYFVKKESENYIPYVHSLLLTILIATFFITDEIYRIALWSSEALFYSYILKKNDFNFLANWILVYISSAFAAIFFIPDIIFTDNLTTYVPILNNRLLTFIFPSFAAYSAYKIFSKSANNKVNDISFICKFVFISLINIFIIFELNDFVASKVLIAETSQNYIKNMIWAILGFNYAIQTQNISKQSNNIIFGIISLIVYIVALLLLIGGVNYESIDYFIPVVNIRVAAYTAGIIASVIYANKIGHVIFKYIAVMIGFGLFYTETDDILNKWNLLDMDYLISIVWMLYSGIITTVGIFKNSNVLKTSGIFLCLFTLVRIFVYDLANVEMIYKLILFIVLGLIFLIISYCYNKNS